jgi:nitronate monooxygenase
VQTLSTRLTRQVGLRLPIVSAPMAFAAGGALAAAVSRAGGLGLIGGGYGERAWIDEQFALAGSERADVGVGFITWSLARQPELLTHVLRTHRPSAVMLSFGDPRPFADEVREAGAVLICQCQTIAHVEQAIEARAGIVIAQGAEAGGHGASRATLTLVPEVADWIAAHSPDTLLLAAGGIGDGRGLAAALMLGADGALVGTRLWASEEALVKPRHHEAILHTAGDGTLRTRIPDIVRGLDWPAGFTARIRRNAFTERWHGKEDALRAAVAEEGPKYAQAFSEGDPENTAVWFGEAAGLVDRIEPAGAIVERMAAQAAGRMQECARTLTGAARAA